MNKKIDPDQVWAMFKTGFNETNIAKRLECPKKQISKILSGQNLKPDHEINSLIGTDYEHHLWYRYYLLIGDYSEVAYRFGVSRLRIYLTIERLR